MTVTNHALTGAIISTFMPWPIALPVALASHFVLDALPHYGLPGGRRAVSRLWRTVVVTDVLICVGLIVWALRHHHYALYACGQIAVIPDFIWVFRVFKDHSFDFSVTRSRFERWHKDIQRHEFPKGLWLEVPLATVLLWWLVSRT